MKQAVEFGIPQAGTTLTAPAAYITEFHAIGPQIAQVKAFTGLAEAEAKRVVAEVRKILGLPTSSAVNQHVDGTADQRRQGDLTPAETADQPKTYEPERSPAETPVSPTDKPVTK